jgi:hypothetical protein
VVLDLGALDALEVPTYLLVNDPQGRREKCRFEALYDVPDETPR